MSLRIPLAHLFPRTRLAANVGANFAGRITAAIAYFLLSPIYLHLLGVEAFGVVGFFLSLYAFVALLDLGLSAAVTRQVAALNAAADASLHVAKLLVTLEYVYWGVALLIAVAGTAVAPLIATYWLNPEHMSQGALQAGTVAMAFALASQFPFALYAGALSGLQRQVLLNAIMVSATIVRGVVTLAALYIEPTLEVFFWVQTIIGLAQAGITRFYVAQYMACPPGGRRFSLESLRGVWRFAAGMSGISVLAAVLSHADKMILSKTLSLESFAHYSVAWLLASGLYFIVSPFFSAVYPRFAELAVASDTIAVARIYHRACRSVATLVIPIGLVVALFSSEVLLLWTRSAEIAAAAGTILTILALGSVLNALMNIPYALQLAYGWTALTLKINAVAVLVLLPVTAYVALNYDATYVALAWLTLNASYVVIGIHLMHTRLLPAEKWRWYGVDVLCPLIGALIVILPVRMWLPADVGAVSLVGIVSASAIAAVVSAHVVSGICADTIEKNAVR